MIDEREWQGVLQVARAGSFSLAAERLLVPKSSLLQCVRKVERELGEELFHKRCSPLRLTAAGELYVRKAREFERLRKELFISLAKSNLPEESSLVVAGLHAPMEYYLAPLAGHFRELFPGMRLSMLKRFNSELVPMLLGGEADLALLYEPLYGEGIETVPLLKEQLLLAVPPGHRLTRGMGSQPLPPPSISFAELASEQIILQDDFWVSESFEELCERAGVTPRVSESRPALEAVQRVLEGEGVALITDLFLYRVPLPQAPFFLSLEEKSPKRYLSAAFRASGQLAAGAQRLIKYLQEHG